MKKIELLAPAGNLESLLAAVHSGADAVYFGYGELNARRNAKNFDEDSLREASRICKERGVKMHMTVNTMVYDREYEQVMRTLEIACRYGIDALIVQDLGVAALVRKAAPEMPMHASTQLTVHNLSGALEAKQLGFSRVVLAREMSRSEIAAIASQAQIETEVFVHGALCMCVSGQCYMSSVIGERSGNRGLCAQPCRLPFSSGRKGDSGYALSLKDLSLAHRVQELVQLGVDSFKIEGRMKRPEYVAAAVSQFKQALEGQQADMDLMAAVFSTEELVHRSLEKMGGTFYMLDGLRCQLDDGLICPASQLNALRRQALEQLTEQRGEIVAKPFYRLEPQKVQKHQPKRQPDGSLPLRA